MAGKTIQAGIDMHIRSPLCKYTRHPLQAAAALALLVVMQGCATLDRDECMVADWRLIGYQDGVAGKSSSALGTYREDCAKHAVVPDLDAYQAGRAEGLLEYCKADNGYRLGNGGYGYPVVCPASLEPNFRAAYNEGRELFLARSAVKETRSRIRQYESDLQYLEEDRQYKLAELVSEGLKGSDRVLILYELSELEKERNMVEEELTELHYELADRKAYLESLTQHHASR